MNAAALALLLPVAPRPAPEERLSSWLSRIARIYDMSARALLAQFGLAGPSALTLEYGLAAGQGALIAARTGLSAPTIDGMTFSTLAPHARFLIAPSARYFCPCCAENSGDRPEGRGAALDLLVFRARRSALGARKAADGELSSRKRSQTP